MSANEKTKAKFTAGPWDVRSNLGGLAEVAVKGGARIAEVWTTCNSEQNREANARLIAAAPDLLAALVALRDWTDEAEIHGRAEGTPVPAETPSWDATIKMVHAAIAAARGGK